MKRAITLAAALMLIAAGCGGAAATSNSPAPPAPATPVPSPSASQTPNQTVALEQAVKAYSKACLTGDAKAAWQLLSEKSRDGISKDAFRSAIAQIAKQYGKAKMTSLKVVAIGEGAALVTYRYTMPAIDQVREPWVLEGGDWRNDN